MTTPLNLPIVDAQGRPTPSFLKTLQQINVSQTDAMPAPSPLNIKADYTGTFLPNALPATVQLRRLNNGVDVSAQSQWAMTTVSGTLSASIAGGIITVTSLSSTAAMLQVRSVRNGVALYDMVSINKVIGSTPLSGSGGSSSASVTTFSSINSTVHSVITSTLSVTVGASGNVALSAPLNVSTAASAPTGTFAVYGKWQWYNGTSWVDVASEVQTSPDCDVTGEPNGMGGTFYSEDDGILTVNVTKTGLTNGSTAKFQLLARKGSGTRTMTFSGTASAVPQ